MRGKICCFTTLEFICSVFAVFLAVAQPHAGDAVPTWTSKVAFFALLPMGNWDKQQNQVSPWSISSDWVHYLFLSSLKFSYSTLIIISENEICLKSFLIEAGFLNLPMNAHAKCGSLCVFVLGAHPGSWSRQHSPRSRLHRHRSMKGGCTVRWSCSWWSLFLSPPACKSESSWCGLNTKQSNTVKCLDTTEVMVEVRVRGDTNWSYWIHLICSNCVFTFSS